MTYPHTQLLINGQWCDAAAGESLAVFNPATGKEIGRVAHARIARPEKLGPGMQVTMQRRRGRLGSDMGSVFGVLDFEVRRLKILVHLQWLLLQPD